MNRGFGHAVWGLLLMAATALLSGCEKPREDTHKADPVQPAVVEPVPVVDPMTALGKQLHDPDPVRRRDAASRVGELAASGRLPDGPLQQLINAFDMETDPDAQIAIIRALGQSCHPAALDVLVRSLKGEPLRVRGQTLQVLGDIGNFPVAEALDAFALKMADDDSPEARALIIQAEDSRKRIMQRAGRRVECIPTTVPPAQ